MYSVSSFQQFNFRIYILWLISDFESYGTAYTSLRHTRNAITLINEKIQGRNENDESSQLSQNELALFICCCIVVCKNRLIIADPNQEVVVLKRKKTPSIVVFEILFQKFQCRVEVFFCSPNT